MDLCLKNLFIDGIITSVSCKSISGNFININTNPSETLIQTGFKFGDPICIDNIHMGTFIGIRSDDNLKSKTLDSSPNSSSDSSSDSSLDNSSNSSSDSSSDSSSNSSSDSSSNSGLNSSSNSGSNSGSNSSSNSSSIGNRYVIIEGDYSVSRIDDDRKIESCRSISKFVNNDKFNDCCILVGPDKVPIYAHKYIICEHEDGSFFKSLFDENFKKDPCIPLIDPNIFLIILNYLYTGYINYDLDTTILVLSACDYLSIDSLFSPCLQYLYAIINKTNALIIATICSGFYENKNNYGDIISLIIDRCCLYLNANDLIGNSYLKSILRLISRESLIRILASSESKTQIIDMFK